MQWRCSLFRTIVLTDLRRSTDALYWVFFRIGSFISTMGSVVGTQFCRLWWISYYASYVKALCYLMFLVSILLLLYYLFPLFALLGVLQSSISSFLLFNVQLLLFLTFSVSMPNPSWTLSRLVRSEMCDDQPFYVVQFKDIFCSRLDVPRFEPCVFLGSMNDLQYMEWIWTWYCRGRAKKPRLHWGSGNESELKGFFSNTDGLYARCYEKVEYERLLRDALPKICNSADANWFFVLDGVISILSPHFRFYTFVN